MSVFKLTRREFIKSNAVAAAAATASSKDGERAMFFRLKAMMMMRLMCFTWKVERI